VNHPETRVLDEVVAGGRAVRLTLSLGRGNILTSAGIEALVEAFGRAFALPRIRAVVLDAQGEHFSFGASVAEHLPGQVEALLPRFHRLLRGLLLSPVPVVAAIRGNCLGGGLELALACTRILAHPSARFGQPEALLGVFAPAASVLLPARIQPSVAFELLLSGRTVGAATALDWGLVDAVCDEAQAPEHEAMVWVEEALLSKSASSLRLALRAARAVHLPRILEALDEVEHLYLHDLMATGDAREGLQAFLEKRPPRFEGEGAASPRSLHEKE